MPLGIRIIAILSLIGGIFGILWSMAVMGLGGLSWFTGLVIFEPTIRMWGGANFWGGMFGILTGFAQIIVAIGMFMRQSWAWLLAAISAGLSLIHPIIGLFSGNFWSIFGLIIPGVIFWYLTRPDVRGYFQGA